VCLFRPSKPPASRRRLERVFPAAQATRAICAAMAQWWSAVRGTERYEMDTEGPGAQQSESYSVACWAAALVRGADISMTDNSPRMSWFSGAYVDAHPQGRGNDPA
jgi:hypothetical protein